MMRRKPFLSLLLLLLLGLFCSRQDPEEDNRPPSTEEVAGLEVVHVFPTGKVESVEETNEIVIVFSDPMIALEEIPRKVEFPLRIDPPLTGRFEWRGTSMLAFIPEKGFPLATRFKICIPKGVKSLSGKELKRPYRWQFETVRPKFMRSYPHHHSWWYPLDQPIYLYFNIPMSPKRAKPFIKILEEGRKNVPFTVRNMTQEEKKGNWRFSQWELERTLVLEPKRRYKRDRWYWVELSSGLLAREGNLGMEKDRKFKFLAHYTFKCEGIFRSGAHPPEEGLEFSFTNPVCVADLVANITIEPEVEIPEYYNRWRRWTTTRPYLGVELLPDTVYTVSISSSLTDCFGNKLDKDYEIKVKTISYRPHVSMPRGKAVVESYGDLRYPVKMVNVDSVRLQMALVDPGEVIPLLNTKGIFYLDCPYSEEGFYDVDKIWRPRLPRNERLLLPIELSQLIPRETPYGFIFIQLNALGIKRRSYHKAFLQVTDIGITGKFSAENGLLWITHLHDATPVKHAQVELRNDRNLLLWRGRTDEQGLIWIPGWRELRVKSESRWQVPMIWVFAEDGKDRALINSRWGTGIYPSRFGIKYDWCPEPRRYEGFIYTEKGLYRAGQEVHIKGLVREKLRGEWHYPSLRDFKLLIKDARDEELVNEPISLSPRGSFDYTLKLGQDATTGVYKIELSGQVEGREISFFKSFRVEAYRPAQFEVKVDSRQKEFFFGDVFTADISGWYLFGSPMAGDEVSWNITLSPFRYRPPGWDGYRFGPGWIEERDKRRRIGSGSGKLDQRGKIKVSSKLDPQEIKGSMRLTCEGTVTAKDKRSISGRKDWIVHRGEYYIGIKPLRTFLETGDTLRAEIVTVKPSGELLPGKDLEFKVYRREWYSVRKAATGGRYHWISEFKDSLLVAEEVSTDIKPVRMEFIPEKPGQYFVRCTGRDTRGNKVLTSFSFWVSGRGYVSWMRRDDDIVELVKDRELYRPGENAKILVKSPYEKAIALVTVEREFVLDRFLTHIEGSADAIIIPIKEQYLPNVFVSVILLQGRRGHQMFSEEGEDVGKPSFKIGYVNLNVSPLSKRLRVSVRTDRREYRPGEEVVVDLEVKTREGEPLRSELSLAVVDLGVLSLIGYQTPDPFSRFYCQRPLSVRTSESRLHIIGERNYGEKGEVRGGGGVLAKPFPYREKFLETAYWNPNIETDGDGRARVKFKLPDNLTTFKLMVVASTSDRFGSGDTTIVVNKPLLLTPSVPRFVRLGDEFWGGVLVHNRTLKDGNVEVKASGQGVRLLSGSRKSIKVKAKEEEEVLFHWTVEDTGGITLCFKARMGDETDALKLNLDVELPKTIEAVAIYEDTDRAAEQWVRVPDSIYAGVGGLYISLSSSALAGIERGLEYLQIYPYDCLEQHLSKVLPFILAEDVINAFNLSELKGEELRQFVAGVLKEVKKYQDENGGFHPWKPPWHGCPPNPYLSTYAMYTLAMAKRGGYEIDKKMVEKGIRYLKSSLRKERWRWGWPYSLNSQLTTCAFMVYALALWDQNEAAYINRLYERRDQMSIFGKALLIKAIREVKLGKEMVSELVRTLYNKIKIEPTMAHFEEWDERGLRWIFHSNVRTTALVLQTLLEVEDHVPLAEKMVNWLNTKRKAGRWGNTQENTYVFHAFCTYFRKYETQKPQFTARVLLDTKEIIRELFEGRSLETRQEMLPLDSLPKEQLMSLKVSKDGTGRLYYGVRLVYAKKGRYEGINKGIAIKKEITPLEGDFEGFERGRIYKVKLTLYTPQERLFVAVEDPIPAGFKIIDTSFRTISSELREKLWDLRRKGSTRWWGSFDHEEIYDDRYLIFATSLDTGEHTFFYLVKAMTKGRFLLPPTKAEEMYSPEVFGTTSQDYVEVR